MALAAALLTAVLAWNASEFAREVWWPVQPHEAVGLSEEHAGITVTSAAVSALPEVPTWDGPWAAPAGFQLWELSLGVDTHQQEVSTVTVYLEDEQGRLFEAADNVPSVEGYESYLGVALPDPDDDPIPPQQRMLVLTPADVVPAAIRVEAAYALNPAFFRLPVSH